jgi:hypothetical protein
MDHLEQTLCQRLVFAAGVTRIAEGQFHHNQQLCGTSGKNQILLSLKVLLLMQVTQRTCHWHHGMSWAAVEHTLLPSYVHEPLWL